MLSFVALAGDIVDAVHMTYTFNAPVSASAG
jgi:hypothetical protein